MLEAIAVSRIFKRAACAVTAVTRATLKLPPGNITAVVGRSGSGKSTLLNLLAGLLTPTEGEIRFNGQDIYQLSDAKRSRLRNEKIGVIQQGQTALLNLTVRENVLLPCALYPDGGDAEGRARELLEQVGIGALADAMPASLSGGELRRMAVARALIRQPEVILADEPTSDLDGENTAAVMRLLRQATGDRAAVLLVTHETDTLQYADAVYQMDSGVLYETRK